MDTNFAQLFTVILVALLGVAWACLKALDRYEDYRQAQHRKAYLQRESVTRARMEIAARLGDERKVS